MDKISNEKKLVEEPLADRTTDIAVAPIVEKKEAEQIPNVTKVAQNQTYDVSWLRHMYGIEVKGVVHDTMHAQHVLQPELEKSLGYLGSIYTNEGAWKNLTNFSKSTKAES